MLPTGRLLLRQWQESDFEPFLALNQDSQVMAYFPALYSEQEARHFIQFSTDVINDRGWGFWAVEILATGEFIGMVGLNEVPFELPLRELNGVSEARVIEIGWRLARQYWGQGYAPEAATASLQYAFGKLDQTSVCGFTPVPNQRSRRVMEKLGMSNSGQNFIHPRVDADSWLAEHVLYDLSREEFLKNCDWNA